MSFIGTEFIAFFSVVLGLYWAIRDRRWQNRLLLAASYLFYGWVHPWMVVLLGGISVVCYAAAFMVVPGGSPEGGEPDEDSPAERRRAAIVAGTVAVGIGVLCGFKYFGWFVDSFAEFLPESVRVLKIGLPLGLSFYTFHNLAYTIDVYRGRIPLHRDATEYMLFASYFPQLVAGPVERASNMLPQFAQDRAFRWDDLRSGFGLALWGGFKKVAIADTISPYVDMLFQHQEPSWAMVWAGALGFTIQALADFSGYTDIARGTSRMLGIKLMDNFAHPYLSATPMEFWQRWHISFSTWLRDYVYLPACFSPWVRRWITVPFSGEWGAFAHTSRALFITMLASGIWHGSTWNFIVWGLYHATVSTLYTWIMGKLPKKLKKQSGWRWVTVPVMFHVTVLGMYIFREPSLERTWTHLQLSPLEGTEDQWIVATSMLALCGLAATPMVAALLLGRYVLPQIQARPWLLPLETTAWALLFLGIFSSARTTAADFIYFQF